MIEHGHNDENYPISNFVFTILHTVQISVFYFIYLFTVITENEDL